MSLMAVIWSALTFILESFGPLGAGIAAFTGVGAGLGMGFATGKAVEACARQPEAAGKIRTMLLIGLALAETTALYGLLVAFIVYGA